MNPSTKKRFLFFIIPVVVYAAVIFSLSSISHPREELSLFFGFDKLLHVIEYYVFGYLLMRLFVTSPKIFISKRRVTLTIVAGILYAISDEWHQLFVPGRCMSVYDMIFDFLGVVVAAVSYTFVRYRCVCVDTIEKRLEHIQI